jgi:hypothetical protein
LPGGRGIRYRSRYALLCGAACSPFMMFLLQLLVLRKALDWWGGEP